jgi:predicted transglutaminase-like cysteine proteinase
MRKKSQNRIRPLTASGRVLAASIAGAVVTVASPVGTAQAQAHNAQPYNGGAQYLSLGASAAMAFEPSHEAVGPGSALDRITRIQGGETVRPVLASLNYAPPQSRAYLEPAVLRSPSLHRAVGPSPDVFGSTALAVGRTALDGDWRKVANARQPGSGRWKRLVRQTAALPAREQLAYVNRHINHAIRFEDDARLYGQNDYWASAAESLARGRGDCEDYAIAKMELLRAAGVPSSDLYLVVARDLVRRVDHAVLAVRLDDGYYILDSGGDQVLPAEAVRDYRPVLTYSVGKSWMHGFRQAPSVVLASADRLAPSGGLEPAGAE